MPCLNLIHKNMKIKYRGLLKERKCFKLNHMIKPLYAIWVTVNLRNIFI